MFGAGFGTVFENGPRRVSLTRVAFRELNTLRGEKLGVLKEGERLSSEEKSENRTDFSGCGSSGREVV